MAVCNAAFALLPKEFGDLVVRVAPGDTEDDMKQWTERVESWIEQYLQTKSAGKGSGNRSANIEWAWFAEIHRWCVANKEAVELKMREIERKMDAGLEASRLEQASLET